MWANERKNPPPDLATAGNENTGLLKAVAMLSMTVDHAGMIFFPMIRELRFFGRLAFPLFAWCLVIGSLYTRCRWKYALRLLAAGVVSQLPWMWLMNTPWNDLNIFFTLLLGLLALWGIEEKRAGSHIWAPVGALVTACLIQVDYGWQGIAFILILYACRGSRPAIAAGMAAFCLYWASGTIRLTSFFGIPVPLVWPALPNAGTLPITVIQVQFWAILALPLLLIPMKKRLALPQWVGYVFYPAHLLILGILYRGMGIR